MFMILSIIALILALIPAVLFICNIQSFHAPGGRFSTNTPAAMSVLIPARNEQEHIRAVIASVLANEHVELEVMILDDHSTDQTAAIVGELSQHDPRVHLIASAPLPENWCGKQHACWQLAQKAHYDLLVFLDADVELSPQALSAMAAFINASGAALASGFPYQKTETLFEKLLIPLMHFVLLGFLPLYRMRKSNDPAYSAGCGQLFIARKSAYIASGGHCAIRASRHDGITLPRAFRRAGFKTDLFDATTLASCRMYQSASQVFNGLAKNATEGLAAPKLIVPATLVLLGGQVMPSVVLLLAVVTHAPLAVTLMAGIATVLSYLPRLIAVIRFRQSLLGALTHPIGVTLLVLIQWYALLRHALGMEISWRGR
jgi:hypothetical protein